MVEIAKLDNGLTVVTENNPNIYSFDTQVWVGAGSRYESKEKNGISHFLEHMFFKGSEKFPDKHMIERLIERSGGYSNAFTHQEWVYYMIKAPSTEVELSNDILSSLLKKPLFRSEDIVTEKGAVINEIKNYLDDPSNRIWKLFGRLRFGDQPLGWEISGDEDRVRSFTKDDITAYMDSLYSPSNMVLIYVGNLPKNIFEIADRYYKDLPQRSSFKFEPYKPVKQTKNKIASEYRKTEKVQVVLGMDGYDRFSPKIQAVDLLSRILGEGGSSRLYQEVRDKRGLAYGVQTAHFAYQDTGSFVACTSVNPEDLSQTLTIILKEFQKISNEKLTDDVLSESKEMIKGARAMDMEHNHYLATNYGKQLLLRGRIISYREFCDRVDAVTADDLLDVAQEIFNPEKFKLQLLGPIRKKQKEESYKTLLAA